MYLYGSDLMFMQLMVEQPGNLCYPIFEGTAEQNKVTKAAYASICNATYAGEFRNWTFENYSHLHQEAHYDLVMYREIMSESRKVTDFIRGIWDPQCAVAKGIILATPTHLNNFTASAQFIASFLNITISNAAKTRNISVANTNKGNSKRDRKSQKLTRPYLANGTS